MVACKKSVFAHLDTKNRATSVWTLKLYNQNEDNEFIF